MPITSKNIINGLKNAINVGLEALPELMILPGQDASFFGYMPSYVYLGPEPTRYNINDTGYVESIYRNPDGTWTRLSNQPNTLMTGTFPTITIKGKYLNPVESSNYIYANDNLADIASHNYQNYAYMAHNGMDLNGNPLTPQQIQQAIELEQYWKSMILYYVDDARQNTGEAIYTVDAGGYKSGPASNSIRGKRTMHNDHVDTYKLGGRLNNLTEEGKYYSQIAGVKNSDLDYFKCGGKTSNKKVKKMQWGGEEDYSEDSESSSDQLYAKNTKKKKKTPEGAIKKESDEGGYNVFVYHYDAQHPDGYWKFDHFEDHEGWKRELFNRERSRNPRGRRS